MKQHVGTQLTMPASAPGTWTDISFNALTLEMSLVPEVNRDIWQTRTYPVPYFCGSLFLASGLF